MFFSSVTKKNEKYIGILKNGHKKSCPKWDFPIDFLKKKSKKNCDCKFSMKNENESIMVTNPFFCIF